jgi:UDP-N-acetylmuramoyl-tripeptide--D-alanyl-D-alanine ligase
MLKGCSLSQLFALLGHSWNGGELFERASIDSRLVKEGDLFFAIKGERADGHQFLKEIFEKGAVAAVVSQEYQGEDFGGRIVPVEDVVGTMQKLARWGLIRRKISVVGITGSIGKTTTKEFLFHLLEGKFRVGKTPGNSNSQIGLPLSLMNHSSEDDILIVEMGMSVKGQIAKLVEIAPPDFALITKIGHSHVDSFEDGLEGVAAAKAEILSHPKTRFALINTSAKPFQPIHQVGSCQKTFYGDDPAADVNYVISETGVVIRLVEDVSSEIALPFSATHLIENFVGAASIARKLGMEWSEIALRAKDLHPFKQRFEKIDRDGIVIMNDCYNASPESMKAAIANLSKLSGKTVAVFGGMAGLGKWCEACHRDVARAALQKVDHLLCYGPKTRPMVEVFTEAGRPVEFFLEFAELKERVFQLAVPGDLLLIKGSNFNQLWKLLEP